MKSFNIKLAKREKVLVFGAAGLIGVFILLQLIIFPLFSSKAKLKSAIQAGEKQLGELVSLGLEYKSLQGDPGEISDALAKRAKNFTLFSLLEKLASQAGLKDRIKYIKPSSSQSKGNYKISSVEMQFSEITLKQLYDYLYRVEAPENIITIKRLSIKKNKEKDGIIDATLQASTVQLS